MTEYRGIAPVFPVPDVDATVRWYAELLGWENSVFPPAPPSQWASMRSGRVEIMLQRVEDYAKPDLQPRRGGGVWDAYVWVDDVNALHTHLTGKAELLQGPMDLPYGCRELWMRDLNGYVLVFAQDITGA
ncbi:MAG: VOC family protein [Sphingomonas sp.]